MSGLLWLQAAGKRLDTASSKGHGSLLGRINQSVSEEHASMDE